MKKAVAIKYSRDLPAPFIMATGKGHLAERIRQVASASGVTVVEIPELADVLVELDVGAFVPERFYEIIAELLVWIAELDRGV